MKYSTNPSLPSFLTFLFFITLYTSVSAQDLDAVWDQYRAEIEKIQNEENAKNFIFTHAKNEFGLTENIMSFLVDLNGGAFTEQIDFLMNVPVQKWNPNIGSGGWGAYELRNVQTLVKKNVTTAFHNVSSYADKIGKGLKYYGLCSSIIQAINGDDGAKLKSVHTTFEIVLGWMTSDFPNMNVAMLSVGFINYALDKFISTTLGEYNEYWWNKYSEYLSTKYPGFVQNWALPSMQGDVGTFLESRLSEFWDSAEQFDQGAPLYRNSEYAKNMYGPSFAARYYNEYLHKNLLAWAQRNAELEEVIAWRESERNARELNKLIEEIKILMAAIEAAKGQMNVKTPSSLLVIPAKVNLETGESVIFKAMAVYEDQTYTDVTELETASWSSGTSSFTVTEETEAGEHIITVTYMNQVAKAIVTVVGREAEEETACGDNQEWSEKDNKCVCIDGYEMIEGKCVSLDEAIKDITEEKPETICDEESMARRLTRLQEIVAESQFKAAQFNNILNQFTKAVNEKSRNSCNDQIIATAYAGALQLDQDFQDFEDEATQLSSELIFEAAICQMNDPKFDISSIIGLVGQLGSPLRRVNQGISSMESELLINGCDKQEIADRGNAIAETTADPEVIAGMESGGIIQPPNQIPGGTMGVIAAAYSGMNAPMSSVNLSVNFNFRTFNFALGSDDQQVQNFENGQLKEGDRMQITVHGTYLNPTITLLPSDFVWIDLETNQQTSPGNGLCLFTAVIGIYFNDDEDVNRYEMIVGIGTFGYGIPGFPEGYGRELRF